MAGKAFRWGKGSFPADSAAFDGTIVSTSATIIHYLYTLSKDAQIRVSMTVSLIICPPVHIPSYSYFL